MATIASLPNETLSRVMEMLQQPSQLGWDTVGTQRVGHYYDNLRAASLVCSRWRNPAQRALHDSVSVPSAAFPVMSSLFVSSSARLRHRTRELLVASPEADGEWLTMAHACAGLSRLCILDDQADSESAELSWHELAHPCFAGVKQLSIMSPENFVRPTSEANAVSLTMRLTSLSLWLNCLDDEPSTSSDFIAALFTSSSNTLETFHLRSSTSAAEIPLYSSWHIVAPNLRTVILETSYDPFAEHLDLFNTCESLTELRIGRDYSESFDQSVGALHVSALLDALPSPPTLLRLSVNIDDLDQLDSFLPLLDHSATSLLEELSFPRLLMEWSADPAVFAMAAACEAHGIEIIFGD